MVIKDKKNNKDFLLEIINEKTIKVVRILYIQNAYNQQVLIKDKEEKKKEETSSKIKIIFKNFGMSIINSQAREIAYVYLTNFKFSYLSTLKNRKVSIKAGNIQIDNQLVRQNDAIIL